jgi:ligand-binding sensor domain-containing protein/putative methionine-R-sulfoxide reductase with GAF domain
MRIRLYVILFFLFTSLINFVNAQQQIFKNYTVNDGLISNDVRRIFQDSKGFLWIGTMEGLSKYDGNTFTNFTKSQGLSHSVINDFFESNDGRVYVALNNGIIDEITDDKVIAGSANAPIRVNRFLMAPWHQPVALTDSNGFQYFRNGQVIKPRQDQPGATFFSAVMLSDTSLAATDNTYLKVFNKNFKLISELKITDDTYSELGCYKDSKGRLWILPRSGIQLIQFVPGSNPRLLNVDLPAAFEFLRKYNISDLFEDDEENMWFATSTGIVKLKIDGSHQIFTVKDGLTSSIIATIFQDKEKNLWFGTAVGLSKLVTKSGITLYPIEDGVLRNDYQFLMFPYKEGHFLVGTSKRTKDFNKVTGIFSPAFKSNDDYFYQAVLNTNPVILTGHTKSVTFDTLLMQPHTIPALSDPSNVRILTSDKTGNSFTGNINGLFFISENGFQKICDDRISGFLIDRNKNLWVGSWVNGLIRFRYKIANKNIQILETKYFLPNTGIRSLYEDTEGNIWAGSRFHGVFRLTKDVKDSFNILNLSQSDGLTSNFIKAIREDANGNFWIAFFQGLDKLIPQNNKFQIFNFSRVNNFFTSVIGMEIDEDNLLWLATAEGIVRIKDGELEKSSPLPVYINRIYSSDTTYPLHPNKLKFNYRQKDLQFEYSSPGYINEKQILYSYRLMGNDDLAWSEASNRHTVSFAGLAPGKYQFQVKSLGWNGIWGVPATVDFEITPPFWKTGWFISLMAMCIAALIYLFVIWRIKNVRAVEAEKLKLQQLNAEQYKNELELEQVINYFSTSLIGKNTVDDVLWDVAKNLIGKLGFADCMIYLWNEDKTKMIQKAGFGPKGTLEEINKQYFDVLPGQGVVGDVMQTKEPVLISDTSKDTRYRADEMIRCSEITVPVIYNNELIGVIDSEHPKKNFFTSRHLHIMNTIAALIANKIKSFEAEQSLLHSRIEIYSMSEQLSKAKLEALRSQMNPHFIFNCINSIDALIQSNDKYYATVYLNKFAKLLRNILDSSKQNTVSLSKDLETLQLYIELEKFRHENKFTAAIEADDELLQDDYKVPALIVQPFVENAILHGLRYRKDNNGHLTICVTKQLNSIQYIIEDNGVGRNTSNKKVQKDKTSYGIDMSNERVRLFNKEEKASVKIIDLFETGKPAGTRVEVSLKIEE